MQNNSQKQARRYVGGNFDTAGKKQFDFLVGEGLKPHHTLLDIGCGALRAGRYFIEYLDFRHYCGIEHHDWLVKSGIEHELDKNIYKSKKPILIIDNDFNFNLTRSKFDYALAKSVFTHLTKKRIEQCLDNLYSVLKDNGIFYASISVGNPKNNPIKDSDTKRFRYTVEDINNISDKWEVEDLGVKGTHKQHMLKLTKKI